MLSRKFSKGSFFSLISDMSVDLDLFFTEILGSDGNVIRILAFRTLLDEIEGRSPNRPVLEPLVMEGCETRQKMNSKPFTFDEHTPKALRETKSVYLSKKNGTKGSLSRTHVVDKISESTIRCGIETNRYEIDEIINLAPIRTNPDESMRG